MKIVRKEIRLDQNIKLPFRTLEDAKKGIILDDMYYINDGYTELLKFYMLDDGSNNHTFLITGLYEKDVDDKLKLDNFLCSVIEQAGNGKAKKIFLFIIKKDNEDYIDLSRKNFYRNRKTVNSDINPIAKRGK